MYDLILQSSLVISLSAIIYLLARAVPRVRDEDLAASGQPNYFEQLIAKVPVSKIDNWATMFVAKFLRRIRLIVLKFDNLLHRKITSVSSNGHKNNNSNLVEDLNKEENKI